MEQCLDGSEGDLAPICPGISCCHRGFLCSSSLLPPPLELCITVAVGNTSISLAGELRAAETAQKQLEDAQKQENQFLKNPTCIEMLSPRNI